MSARLRIHNKYIFVIHSNIFPGNNVSWNERIILRRQTQKRNRDTVPQFLHHARIPIIIVQIRIPLRMHRNRLIDVGHATRSEPPQQPAPRLTKRPRRGNLGMFRQRAPVPYDPQFQRRRDREVVYFVLPIPAVDRDVPGGKV